ncbi:MAG: hypothetical protein ACI4UJ_09470 [Candidatus Cryptobacteroides sp.]
METDNNTGRKTGSPVRKHGRFRWLKITLAVIAGLWLVLMAVIQVVMTPAVMKNIVEKIAAEYVDADVRLDDIRAHMFRSFPNIVLTLEGLEVTYPHDRYARYDTVGIDGRLRHAGRGETMDTLASLRSLRLSVNYIAAAFGQIHVNEATLDRPRIFAHWYSPDDANWNILKNISVSETEDTSVTVLPPIAVNRIALTGRPAVFYTDCQDTVFAAVALKEMAFQGRLHSRKSSRNKLGLRMDSLFVTGRLPADTLAVALDHFNVDEKSDRMHFDAAAKAFAGTSSYGRIMLPLALRGDVSLPEDEVPAISLRNVEAGLAGIEMTADADLKLYRDSTYIRAEAAIDEFKVNDFIQFFGKNFLPGAADLETDAKVTLTALCDGYYNPATNTLPELIAEIVVPGSYVRYPGIPEGQLRMDVNAATDPNGKLDVTLDDMCLIFAGVDLDATGSAYDLLGEDPLLNVNARAEADLDTLSAHLPDSLGIRAGGLLNAALNGNVRLSQLNADRIYRAGLEGYVRGDSIALAMPADTMDLWLGGASVGLATVKNTLDTKLPRGEKILAITAGVDTLRAVLGTGIVRASKLAAQAQNASQAYTEAFGKESKPILGSFDLGRLFYSGTDSLFMGLLQTRGNFKVSNRVRGDLVTPLMTLNANISRAFGRAGVNRAGFKDISLGATAVMTTFERNQRRDHLLDSLQRVYPGVRRDSLFRRAFGDRMKEKKQDNSGFEDVRLDLGATVSKYLREWAMNASLDISNGIFYTPYFPLKNSVSDVRFAADNNRIALDNITVNTGGSDVLARGEVTNIRPAMMGRAPLKLDLKVTSEKIDANELLAAYSAGMNYRPETGTMSGTVTEDMSEFITQAEVPVAEVADTSVSLIVIPSNVEATISLEANDIDYSELCIDWMASDIVMRNRCLQLTNTVATSNMGDIYFEGFYSTRSKTDIKTGFDLNLADITADKVVQLFPVVDSIMPMLTSFKGQLDCEIAATTDLDTCMNILTPTMSGVLKIKGRDVSVEDSPEFRKLAKTLMFKDKNIGKIADMSVSGIVSDNRLEIFPFVLKVDRYTMAMSGLQEFDQNFKYHVSVLKSPLPFRFGINLFGNFDKWKFKIGKAKYKNTNVPVFTAIIDTTQMNLINAIHNIFTKGVEAAFQANNSLKEAVAERKAVLGYDAESDLDSLDTSQMQVLDSLQAALDAPDSVALAPFESIVQDADVREEEPGMTRREARRQRRAERREKRNAEAIEEEQ